MCNIRMYVVQVTKVGLKPTIYYMLTTPLKPKVGVRPT